MTPSFHREKQPTNSLFCARFLLDSEAAILVTGGKLMRIFRLFLLATLATSSVQAEIIFNNLGPGDTFSASGRILIGPTAGVFSDINQAASFSVGQPRIF